MKHICTSHVGSFPLEYSEERELKVFNDMIDIGLDYPPVPQLRSFIDMFLEPLARQALLRKSRGLYIAVKNISIESMIIDLPEYKLISNIIPKIKGKVKEVRACITGPFTLASYIFYSESIPSIDIMNSMLRDKEYVLSFLTSYVARIVEEVSKLGYNYINIDEPVLSVIIGTRRLLFNYTIEEITNALDMLFERAKHVKIRGIHVCARLPKLLKEVLLRTNNINLLDHEHYDNRKNFEFYSYEDLDSSGKYIAVGVISSKKPIVENINEIKSLIIKSWNLYRDRLLMVKPDCGFRGLRGVLGDEFKEYELCLRKLKVLVEAVRQVREEF